MPSAIFQIHIDAVDVEDDELMIDRHGDARVPSNRAS